MEEERLQARLAPRELKAVHPHDKSRVITDGDVRIAESGAIVDYITRGEVDMTATANLFHVRQLLAGGKFKILVQTGTEKEPDENKDEMKDLF